KGKHAAAFGSYGWSGEVTKQLTEELSKCGFEVVNEGHRSLWVPDMNEIKVCIEYGKSFMQGIN
ncbi:MAG TPA: anaerobic nitric oxide reductase flavorubredoxin, partial [Lachnospiraceae bacterium]|nr:anaerobic nitric oxide reductase flavorubredoxin [Lachnospiraceae bacterium]